MTPAVSLIRVLSGLQAPRLAKLDYLRLMADVIDAARSERSWQSLEARARQIECRHSRTALVDPSVFSRAFRVRTRAEAEIAVMQAALAVHFYKIKNGRLPNSLEQAKGALGGRLPGDPFTGTSLRYRRGGTKGIVYSVGPNSRDDGGKEVIPHTAAEAEPAERLDDIAVVLDAPQRR